MVLQNELADEELEHFEDIVEETDTQANKTADKPDSDGDNKDDDDPSEDEAGSPAPSSDDEFSDKGDDDLLGFNSLTNLDDSQKASGHAVKNAKSSLPGGYDPRHREPIYCNADRVGWWELMVLASHVHPSVSTMARTLLSGANIVYNGNPLVDLSLGTFLDKFMEKKPKARNWHGGSQIEPAKQMDMSKPLIGADILQLDEMDVAPEDVVFHKFFMNKMNASKKPKKKKKGADEEAVEDFMGDDDIEEDESDNEEIDAILDSTKSALDSDNEYDYDDLDQLADDDDDELVGDGSDDDGMDFPADTDADGDDDDDEVADDKASDDDVSIGDADDGSEDEEDVFEVQPKKRKSRGKSGASPFASLEEYEHLMDDNDNEDADENDDVKDSKKHKKSKKTKGPKSKKKKVSNE